MLNLKLLLLAHLTPSGDIVCSQLGRAMHLFAPETNEIHIGIQTSVNVSCVCTHSERWFGLQDKHAKPVVLDNSLAVNATVVDVKNGYKIVRQ